MKKIAPCLSCDRAESECGISALKKLGKLPQDRVFWSWQEVEEFLGEKIDAGATVIAAFGETESCPDWLPSPTKTPHLIIKKPAPSFWVSDDETER